MEKTTYKTPTVKVVEFKAEHGFAGSAFNLNSTTNNFEMELEDNEARNEQYIFDDGNGFWD